MEFMFLTSQGGDEARTRSQVPQSNRQVMELLKRASTRLPGLFICQKEPETWIFMGIFFNFQTPVRTEQACLWVIPSEHELLQVCPHTSSSLCSTSACWLPKSPPFNLWPVTHTVNCLGSAQPWGGLNPRPWGCGRAGFLVL